jgi:hypothetical protein
MFQLCWSALAKTLLSACRKMKILLFIMRQSSIDIRPERSGLRAEARPLCCIIAGKQGVFQLRIQCDDVLTN